MKTSIIQAVINGKKMQDVAKAHDTSPSKLSLQLQTEMNAVANHPLNAHLSKELAVRNAFAIRRNARTWSIAIANANTGTKQVKAINLIPHVFTADSVDAAFDIALQHDSITKKDAMILVYNTTIKSLQNEL
jgi:hypothetical protein